MDLFQGIAPVFRETHEKPWQRYNRYCWSICLYGGAAL